MSEMKREQLVKIYGEYADMVYFIALQIVKNCPLAEDLLQEVFATMIRTNLKDEDLATGFERREDQKAWVIKITVKLCKDYVKSGYHISSVDCKDMDGCIVNGITSDKEMEFYQRLFSLPYQLAILLYLNYVHGYTHSEMSEILSIKQTKVISNINKARKMLDPVLKDEEQMSKWVVFQVKMKSIQCPVSKKEEVWSHLLKEIEKREKNPLISSRLIKKPHPIKAYIERAIIQKKPLYIALAAILLTIILSALLPHIIQLSNSVKTSDLIPSKPTKTIVKPIKHTKEILSEEANPVITRVDPNGVLIRASILGEVKKFILPCDDTTGISTKDVLSVEIGEIITVRTAEKPMGETVYEYRVVFQENPYLIASISEQIDEAGNRVGIDTQYSALYEYTGDFVLDCSFNQPDAYGVVTGSLIPVWMQPYSTIQFLDLNHYRIISGGAYEYEAEDLLLFYQNNSNIDDEAIGSLKVLQPKKGMYVSYSEYGNISRTSIARDISLTDYRLVEHEIFHNTPFPCADGDGILRYHEDWKDETPQFLTTIEPDSTGNYWSYRSYPGIEYVSCSKNPYEKPDCSQLTYLILRDESYTLSCGLHVGMTEEAIKECGINVIRYEKEEVAFYGKDYQEDQIRLNTFFLRENTNFITRFSFDSIYYASGSITDYEIKDAKELYQKDFSNTALGLILLVKDGKVVAIATDCPTAN